MLDFSVKCGICARIYSAFGGFRCRFDERSLFFRVVGSKRVDVVIVVTILVPRSAI